MTLTWVPFPASVPGPLIGYGGLVSPRTSAAVATRSDGSTRHLVPVSSDGRDYLAVAVPARLRVVRVSLSDRAGHRFATTTSLPAAG